MQKGVKFRIHPNKEQKDLINQRPSDVADSSKTKALPCVTKPKKWRQDRLFPDFYDADNDEKV